MIVKTVGHSDPAAAGLESRTFREMLIFISMTVCHKNYKHIKTNDLI